GEAALPARVRSQELQPVARPRAARGLRRHTTHAVDPVPDVLVGERVVAENAVAAVAHAAVLFLLVVLRDEEAVADEPDGRLAQRRPARPPGRRRQLLLTDPAPSAD